MAKGLGESLLRCLLRDRLKVRVVVGVRAGDGTGSCCWGR